MRYVLGIDLGTTGVKAIIFDHECMIVGSGTSMLPIMYPKPDWVEQDPGVMWSRVLESVQKALAASRVEKNEIEAIGIAHQGESVLAWDADSGEPLYNNIVWQDRRSDRRCRELKSQEKLSNLVRRRTGLNINAYFSSSKIEWLLMHVSEIRDRASGGKVRIGTPDTWLVSKLTGGRSYYTDYTSASRTMLFDFRELEWDDDLLNLFSIPREILAVPRPCSGFFGMSDPKEFLGIEAPITGVVVDTQGALFGHACFKEGDIKNTYGTCNVIQCNIGDKHNVPPSGIIITIGVGLDGFIKYAAEGTVYITGAVVQWVKDILGDMENVSQSDEIARSVQDTMGVYFVPAFVGLGAPYWESDTRGTIVGLTRGVKKEHLVRAALESIAYQVKDVLRAMENETGVKIKELRVDGGPTKNTFLMQFQSDILGVPIMVAKVNEITSLGAAFIAGLHVGYWKDIREIEELWRPQKIYRPSMDQSKAEELYGGWERTLCGTIDIYRRSHR
jgi:glycerol kinase